MSFCVGSLKSIRKASNKKADHPWVICLLNLCSSTDSTDFVCRGAWFTQLKCTIHCGGFQEEPSEKEVTAPWIMIMCWYTRRTSPAKVFVFGLISMAWKRSACGFLARNTAVNHKHEPVPAQVRVFFAYVAWLIYVIRAQLLALDKFCFLLFILELINPFYNISVSQAPKILRKILQWTAGVQYYNCSSEVGYQLRYGFPDIQFSRCKPNPFAPSFLRLCAVICLI